MLALSFMPPAPGRVKAEPRTQVAPARTDWRHALGCCALASVVGHGVLLNALTWEPRPKVPQMAATHRTQPAPVTHVRFIHGEAPSPAPRAHPAVGQDEAPVGPTPPAAPILATPQPEAELAPPSGVIDDASASGQAASPATDDTAASLAQFIPRPQLTLPPEVLAPVVLIAPEGETQAARRVGILSLYIDQTGRVHHITSEAPQLPPAYERIAREAFMAATFRPGQLEGHDVKSRIRVEVVFDNTPLDGP
ncbi:MAG: hypothetical protein QM742_12860 [Aquabacterium sp.]